MIELLPSGLEIYVGDDEDLARFLASSSHFNAQGVKHAAFLPSPKNRATSVFRHLNSSDESLRQLGKNIFGSERTLHGVAVCKAQHVRSAQLEVEAAEPPPRHANITGWPWHASDPELEKARLKERAILLAKDAKLIKP